MGNIRRAAERIRITLEKCRWLSPDVTHDIDWPYLCITLFVEVGVVLLILLAFSIAKTKYLIIKTGCYSVMCAALMAVHCIIPPHPKVVCH